jgi:hypothetical protein
VDCEGIESDHNPEASFPGSMRYEENPTKDMDGFAELLSIDKVPGGARESLSRNIVRVNA